MKNSLKFLIGLFFAMMMVGQVSATSSDEEDIHIHDNKYVYSFVPSDIKVIRGRNQNYGAYLCDEHGNEIYQNKKPSQAVQNTSINTQTCLRYHSNSTRKSWVIRYAIAPHGPVYAQQIFQLENRRLKLWASFNERRENIYASTDAQRYASTHSNDDTGIARNQDPENPVQEASKIDPADLIKKGLGAILPKIRW